MTDRCCLVVGEIGTGEDQDRRKCRRFLVGSRAQYNSHKTKKEKRPPKLPLYDLVISCPRVVELGFAITICEE